MIQKLKKIKNLSPAVLNVVLLTSIYLVMFFTGWYNNWWFTENSKSSSNLTKIYSELNQQLKEIEILPATAERNSKIQKFSYQLIVGPISQHDEITSSKEWVELKSFWEKNNLSEIEDNSLDQQFKRLTNSINNLNAYAVEQKYPTLMRVTSRMQVRNISSNDIKSQDAALFAFSKDIEFMQATIRTANITEDKKNDANNRLGELSTIVAELQKDTKNNLQTHQTFKNLLSKVQNVFTVAKPFIAQSNSASSYTFHSIFYFLIFLFVLSVILGSWMLANEYTAKKKISKVLENNFLSIMNDSFVKSNNLTSNAFSQNFQSTFAQLHNYIQKKMQYGQMFQDTIPFPTILIDANLQVRWFNQSLISEWQIEDFIRERESLSWEHFSQLTNMSTNDPVMDVIRNQHAGIFKLQVKPLNSDAAVPYQMYVTPYQIGEEKLCLLFFYPLLSLEETIEMQTQSVVGPVRSTLLAIVEDRFDENFYANSKSDYEIGAIEDLHNLFGIMQEKNLKASNELMWQLRDRDTKIQDQQQIIQNFDTDIEQLKRLQVEMKNSMQNLKNYIVTSFENIDSVKVGNNELFNQLKNHWDRFTALQQNAEKLFQVYVCTKEQVQQLLQLRGSTKEVRDAIQGHKSNANKVIKAMSAFIDKQNQARNPLYNTWNSTVNELSKIPDFLISLDRYIQQIEMILGKVVMRVEDSYKTIDEAQSGANSPNVNLVSTLSSFGRNFDEIENLKDSLINSLREVYVLMQQQIKVTSQSHEHLYFNTAMIDAMKDSDLEDFGHKH